MVEVFVFCAIVVIITSVVFMDRNHSVLLCVIHIGVLVNRL
jgi:hypothetical protein